MNIEEIQPQEGPTASEILKRDGLFKFEMLKTRLTQLRDTFKSTIEKAAVNRQLRFFDVDPQALRDAKEIGEEETIVNVRTINSNIEREQPSFINFLRNSRRIVTFSRKEGKEKLNTELLEEDFTRGMTYSGWEIPFYQELDGSQLHGWDAIEVVFDDSKPFHIAHDHIGNDKLIFPQGSLDIQSHECIMREYSFTPNELSDLVKDFGFDKEQIDLITSAVKDTARCDEPMSIYKVFFKYEKIVYVSWVELKSCSNFLKAPTQHYVGWDEEVEEATPSLDGISPPTTTKTWQRKPLLEYPIFLLRYKLTEQKTIQATNGRAFLDRPKQEALTALWSGFINGATRASNVNASPKQQSGTGVAPKQLDTPFGSGHMWTEPVDFWSPPYPDESMIRAAQNLEVQNSQEVGQLNFAVQNRAGSRTTAKEISSAEVQNNLLNSVQLTLFSTHIRDIFSFDWQIVRSRALQGLVKLLAYVENQVIQPDGSATIEYSNDMTEIAREYDVRAAGDVDVIQRGEMLEKYSSFWPLIQSTSIAPMFMSDMLKIAFPDVGDKYAAAIGQAQMDKELVAKMAQLLQQIAAANPAMLQSLTPEQQAQLQQLQQAVVASQQQTV